MRISLQQYKVSRVCNETLKENEIRIEITVEEIEKENCVAQWKKPESREEGVYMRTKVSICYNGNDND